MVTEHVRSLITQQEYISLAERARQGPDGSVETGVPARLNLKQTYMDAPNIARGFLENSAQVLQPYIRFLFEHYLLEP